MKTLLLLLLPFFVVSQDTTKAKLLILQGKNYHKVVDGYVITVKDSCKCKAVGFLTVRKRPFISKYKVQDYYISK